MLAHAGSAMSTPRQELVLPHRRLPSLRPRARARHRGGGGENGCKVLGKGAIADSRTSLLFLLACRRSRPKAQVICPPTPGATYLNSIKQAAGSASSGGQTSRHLGVHQATCTGARPAALRACLHRASTVNRNDASRAFAKRFAPQYKGTFRPWLGGRLLSLLGAALPQGVEAAKTRLRAKVVDQG